MPIPTQLSTARNDPKIRWNGPFKPIIKTDSIFGLITSGFGAVCGFFMGIAFIGARSTVIGEIAYPMGIVFVVLSGLLATVFFVNLNRRSRALRKKS